MSIRTVGCNPLSYIILLQVKELFDFRELIPTTVIRTGCDGWVLSWIVSLMVDTDRIHGISNCGHLSIYLCCLELQLGKTNKRPTYRCLLNNQIFCQGVLYVQPVLITAEKAFCVTNWTTSNSRALEGNLGLTSTGYRSTYTYSDL